MRFLTLTTNHNKPGRLLIRTSALWYLPLTAMLMSGCVSTSTYDQLNQQYQGVVKERDELSKQVDALQGNTKLLQNKVETTEQQNARIKADLQKTEERLASVNKDLEARTAELQQTDQELKSAKGNLDSTSAELQRRQEELQTTMAKLDESDKKLKATAQYMAKTNKLYDDLVKELSSEVNAKQIKIKELKDGISVNLSEDILFPSGSAQLNKNGVKVIKKVSTKLKDIPHQIIVAGFTDNIPIKGGLAKRYPTNWELAGARAASVVRVLEGAGVDSKKLTAVSFGDNEPVASNDTAEGRAQNRRIEIRLRPVK